MSEREIRSAKENINPEHRPPLPPRTAFICFSDSSKRKIALELGISERSKEILQHVADAWKELSTKEKGDWDEAARSDKMRYVREKSAYKGVWDIPKRRAKKHPLAPKRPMSAFLKYSQTRRTDVKKDNPDMSNTDVSRLLGEMWRNAPAKEKAPYVGREEIERANYKMEIAKFKAEQSKLDAASRTSHSEMKLMAPNSPQKQLSHQRAPRAEGIFKPRLQRDDYTGDHRQPSRQPYTQMLNPSLLTSYSFNAGSFDSSEPLPELYPHSRQPSYSLHSSFGEESRHPLPPPPEVRFPRGYDQNHQPHHYGHYNGRYL